MSSYEIVVQLDGRSPSSLLKRICDIEGLVLPGNISRLEDELAKTGKKVFFLDRKEVTAYYSGFTGLTFKSSEQDLTEIEKYLEEIGFRPLSRKSVYGVDHAEGL